MRWKRKKNTCCHIFKVNLQAYLGTFPQLLLLSQNVFHRKGVWGENLPLLTWEKIPIWIYSVFRNGGFRNYLLRRYSSCDSSPSAVHTLHPPESALPGGAGGSRQSRVLTLWWTVSAVVYCTESFSHKDTGEKRGAFCWTVKQCSQNTD